MLTYKYPYAARRSLPVRQRGVVLLITLIVLVAMTLTAIALVRSMDTTNLIAGNLAFRQSAVDSGDTGVEAAIAWMEVNAANLANDNFAMGYSSSFANPGVNQTWDLYFTNTLQNRTYTVLPVINAVGNTVSYAIERLCTTPNVLPGDPGSNCTVTPNFGVSGVIHKAGEVALNSSNQQYYRVTSRTVGPHNSKSYIQAIIAM